MNLLENFKTISYFTWMWSQANFEDSSDIFSLVEILLVSGNEFGRRGRSEQSMFLQV